MLFLREHKGKSGMQKTSGGISLQFFFGLKFCLVFLPSLQVSLPVFLPTLLPSFLYSLILTSFPLFSFLMSTSLSGALILIFHLEFSWFFSLPFPFHSLSLLRTLSSHLLFLNFLQEVEYSLSDPFLFHSKLQSLFQNNQIQSEGLPVLHLLLPFNLTCSTAPAKGDVKQARNTQMKHVSKNLTSCQ